MVSMTHMFTDKLLSIVTIELIAPLSSSVPLSLVGLCLVCSSCLVILH